MKKGLLFLLTADAFANLGLGMIGPIYAIFVQDIGGDILDASWAFFVFTVTTGVVIYVIGKWENRIHHKENLIIAGYFLTAVGCFAYAAVDSQADLLAVQVLLGVAVAILSPAFDSLYSHYVVRKHEASDWGSWEAMGYLVAAVAAIMGGYIASTFGFKVLFIVMGLVSLIGFAVSLSLLKGERSLNRI